MGYKLRREVRDRIPPGLLTPAERLLILEIADQCNDQTRECWPGAALISTLTDLAPRSIQETLRRIGEKWIELRVVLGKSDKGTPIYAYPGRRTIYRFPPLPVLKGATDRGPLGATDRGASETDGATDPSEWCDESGEMVRQIGGPSPQRSFPQEKPSSLSAPADDERTAGADLEPERDVSDFQDSQPRDPDPYAMQRRHLARNGVTDETELRVLPPLIEEMHKVDTPRAWWAYVDKQGDLPSCIDEARVQIADARSFGAASASARADDWCGVCELPNRWRYVNGDPSKPQRCPECHADRARDRPRPATGYQPYRDTDRDYHAGEL